MVEQTHRIRLIRQFVEPLKPENVPEELREILVIPEGRNYVDVEVPAETAQAIRDLADKRFWTLDERRDAAVIRAAHVQRTHIESKVGRARRYDGE
ncbi:hypothetical protein [Streptomyces sp. NPDC088775]|uniref:hypothetical protein n=1 Tax=Streptomyces sp. NPDC088775 TaxID=3365896 RepID=UPI0038098713